MTITIYNLIKELFEMIKEGFKNITIYKGQTRYYISIGNRSLPLPTGDKLKVAMFIICLILGGIVEGSTVTTQEKEIIREAVRWYSM